MKIVKVLTLSIIFSVVVFCGWRNDVQASTNIETISESSVDSKIFSFIQNLLDGAAQALSLNQHFSDQVTAEMVDANLPEQVMIHGKIEAADSSLPGLFQITLHYNRINQTIIGGQWTRIVQQTTAEESTSVSGTLRGKVTGGSVMLTENGKLSALANVELTVEGGTGNYVQISAGSGIFEGTIRAFEEPGSNPPADPAASPQTGENPPAPEPAFSGTMNLTF